MDLSFLPGCNVNDKVPKGINLGEEFHLTFPSVDALVEMVKKKGRGCLIMKRDLRRAYKQILTDPGDWNLLGFVWDDLLYFDTTMPMGLRSAAMCCQRLTNAVRYIYQKQGYDLVPYLDDLATAEVPEVANQAFETMGDVLADAGLDEAVPKAENPHHDRVFLGVRFNTINLTLSVPMAKVQETMELLDMWLKRESMSRREIQSVVGKLQFLANCVRPGRLFVSRILEYMRGLPETGKHRITDSFRADLTWWKLFLPKYNGISMMQIEKWSVPDEIFASDATLTGCGAWFGARGEYFHKAFPQGIQEKSLSINALELLTIVVAAKVWGKHWRGKRIRVHCDNEVSVMVLNSGRCRNSYLAACLREVELLAAQHEFEIRAVHIAGVDNRIPDGLSRWDMDEMQKGRFMQLVEGLETKEVFVYDGLFEFMHKW